LEVEAPVVAVSHPARRRWKDEDFLDEWQYAGVFARLGL
jgi:hypothetical protein